MAKRGSARHGTEHRTKTLAGHTSDNTGFSILACTLLPLRPAGTKSAAYIAGYTPMMLNSAVKTVFTCGHEPSGTQQPQLNQSAGCEQRRRHTRLHPVVLADPDDLFNEVLVPVRRLPRRQSESVVCGNSRATDCSARWPTTERTLACAIAVQEPSSHR